MPFLGQGASPALRVAGVGRLLGTSAANEESGRSGHRSLCESMALAPKAKNATLAEELGGSSIGWPLKDMDKAGPGCPTHSGRTRSCAPVSAAGPSAKRSSRRASPV